MIMPRKLIEGSVYEGTYGSFKVLEYRSKKEVIVQFTKTGTIRKTSSSAALSGRVKDTYFPTVAGVGCIGNTTSSVNGKIKASYHTWRGMLRRCYQDSGTAKTYYGIISVCKDWWCYEVYEKWYNDNVIEGFQVDKDFTVVGCKIYSPETCCFIPNKINAILGKKTNNTVRIHEGLPVGVSYHIRDKKYTSQCFDGDKLQHFGYHDTPEEAFLAYKPMKEVYIKSAAHEYYTKGDISEAVYRNLMEYEVTP
jgi:hypothetical protein